MAFYSYLFNSDYKSFKEKLKRIAKRMHKSYLILLIDTHYSILKYGIGLNDYLNYEFYKKNNKERLEYVGIKIQDSFYEKVNRNIDKELYASRADFLEKFQNYIKKDFIITDKISLDEFKYFVKKHSFFISKSDFSKQTCLKVNSEDITDIEKYYEECKNNRICLEEVVQQNKVLNKLCEKSYNTIMIMTFNNHGKVEILWSGLRIGRGTSNIDDFADGAMLAEIDLNNGKLISPAFDKNLHEYTYHPKTHVEIKGFKVPYFKRIKKLVKEAALVNDEILVSLWDIIVTDERPLINGLNIKSGFDLIQIASQRGRMDIVNYILEKMEE